MYKSRETKRVEWRRAREEMRRIGEEKGKPKPPEIASLLASCSQTFCMRLWFVLVARTVDRLAYVTHLPAAPRQLRRPTHHFRSSVFFLPPYLPCDGKSDGGAVMQFQSRVTSDLSSRYALYTHISLLRAGKMGETDPVSPRVSRRLTYTLTFPPAY